MMKNLRYPILFPVFMALILMVPACDSQQQQKGAQTQQQKGAQTQPQTQPQTAAPAAPASQVQPKRDQYVWPPAAAKGEEVELAEDLFAKNYYIVLDDSGSMDERKCAGERRKLDVAKEALTVFAKQVPENANLGLMSFDNQRFTEWVPLGLNNVKHKELISERVQQLNPNDGTPMHNAVVNGFRALEKQSQKQLGYGEYHLVIITDGLANTGQEPNEAVSFILENTPIVFHTIGFCIGPENPLNQPGRTIYATATNPAELKKGLQDVLAESESFSDVSEFKDLK
jgi:Ca-activated chloride channel family protein